MLYKEWLNEWLELYVKAATKERTYRKYRQQAEKYILPALGNYDVNALSAVELQKFSVSLSEYGLAPNSINFIIAVLRSSLKKGVQLGIIDRQYGDAIVRPHIRANAVSCFTKEEQKKIESYIFSHDKPYLFGILLALYTGLRIGELLALTWADVDLQKGIMSITKSCYDKWENNHYIKAIDTTKTKSSERMIPIPRQIIVHSRIFYYYQGLDDQADIFIWLYCCLVTEMERRRTITPEPSQAAYEKYLAEQEKIAKRVEMTVGQFAEKRFIPKIAPQMKKRNDELLRALGVVVADENTDIEATIKKYVKKKK